MLKHRVAQQKGGLVHRLVYFSMAKDDERLIHLVDPENPSKQRRFRKR